MSVRRVSLASIVGACLLTVGVVGAQPKKGAPVAPAKEPDPGAAPLPADAGSGSAVAPIEDTPPGDMNGTDENPDAPKGTDGAQDPGKVVAVPDKSKKSGYPMEEALRPITLPQNMSEVSIGPHANLGLGETAKYSGADALRARYGITREVQIGLTYVMGGIFHEPNGSSSMTEKDIVFKPGKAVGLDVTVLLQNWVGVKVGVPVYIDPVAVSIALGAPMKFQLGDKLAIGGLDDLLNIKVKNFAPSFYSEERNAASAFEINSKTNTTTSRGTLKISAYGVYQQSPKMAIIGRFGVEVDDFSSNKTNGHGGTATFLRGGFQYSVKKFLDLGLSLGWEDLADLGSIGPAGFLAVRI